MAERRMFARTIVLSDDFLDMPLSSRCLYFTLGMLADDDGFVNAPKSIMRQCGATLDDMKLLLAKKFLLSFASGVIVIKHWRINNYLRTDRKSDTKYTEEMKLLTVNDNGAYAMVGNCLPDAYQMPTDIGIPSIDKDRLGKDRLDKDKGATAPAKKGKAKSEFIPPTVEEVRAYCQERGNSIDPEAFWQYYTDAGWKRGKSKIPISDWKGCVRTWEQNGYSNKRAPTTSKHGYATGDDGKQAWVMGDAEAEAIRAMMARPQEDYGDY